MVNFIQCPENRLARDAAEKIIHSPESSDLNPLIIIGSGGSGKTHLLHAIANSVHTLYKDLSCMIVCTRELIEKYNKTSNYRETLAISSSYKNLDILLIDDLHLVENVEPVQEQIFHIYNELVSKGKRVIVTSAKAPEQLSGLSGYLRSRMTLGASVFLKAGGDEIRVSILKKIALDRNLKLTEASAKYITNHCTRDINKFNTLLEKIVQFSTRKGKKIAPPLIREFQESHSL